MVSQHKIRKVNGGYEVDINSEAPTIITGEPTAKDPNVKVDMGLQLVPKKIHYDGDYTEEQILAGLEKIDENGCQLCKRTEKSVAMLMRESLAKGPPPAPVPPPVDKVPEPNGFRDRLQSANRPSLANFQNNRREKPITEYRILGRFRGEEKKRQFSLESMRKERPRVTDLFEV